MTTGSDEPIQTCIAPFSRDPPQCERSGLYVPRSRTGDYPYPVHDPVKV